jgi:Insertion element 4 transposase N-terminal/Transposase DDE domain
MDGHGLREAGLGVLTRWCPPELVDAAIDKYGRREDRRRLLPAQTMVYFELARCLFPGEGYEQVFDHLLPADTDSYSAEAVTVPNKSSLCRARSKLGAAVLAEVFRQVAGPLARSDSCPSAFWRGLRLEAFDGTVFDVADTSANAEQFARPAGSRGPGGYPQARVVALVECGTHAVIDAAIGGRQQGETTLAMGLARSAGPGSLVLADRNMLGVPLWNAFVDASAELLWRLKKGVANQPHAELDDGSYLANVRLDRHRAAALRREGNPVPSAIVVRVIEYTLDGEDEVYRLATSLLDPVAAPAGELAALYHERWESEGVFAEVKTSQRGPRAVLASACPDGVRQEIWAHLTVHRLTRELVQHAATSAAPPLDPERISFRRAQQLVRRSLGASLSPSAQRREADRTAARLAATPNPERRPRRHPRAIKRRATPYPQKTAAMRGTRHDGNFAPILRIRPS